MKSGIYQIRNLLNGKVYVGSTGNLSKRRREHKRNLRLNCHENSHLQYSWNKYGEDNFFFGTLQESDTEDLLFYEQLWMDCFCSYERCFGYNISKIAGNCLGVKHTEESKRRMSEAQLGRKHSEETKKKISATRKEAGLSKGINNPNFGKKHPERAKLMQGSGNPCYGDKHPLSKLTWKEVREIRKKSATGKYKGVSLAKEYGVSTGRISAIINNKTWKE